MNASGAAAAVCVLTAVAVRRTSLAIEIRPRQCPESQSIVLSASPRIDDALTNGDGTALPLHATASADKTVSARVLIDGDDT
jgi:hypothetical protein